MKKTRVAPLIGDDAKQSVSKIDTKEKHNRAILTPKENGRIGEKNPKHSSKSKERLQREKSKKEYGGIADTAPNWMLLRTKIRVSKAFAKPFELINKNLLKDKKGDRRSTGLQAYANCLLEHPLDNGTLPGRVQEKGDHLFKIQSSLQNHQLNGVLIKYFISLTEEEDQDKAVVDYGFLESILQSGADVNTTDKHGQSVMHEAARLWNVDVARFLIDHGANINHADDYGRTPLHVACAVDYAEMVEFLLQTGADITCKTLGEEQSAIHYAAKNDSSDSLKLLLKYGADINDTDYRHRTPLQVAAELDRSETARLLIEEGAPCGVYEDNKMAALTLMIQKMPSVALLALDQFHVKNRSARRQYFYLNFLVPPTEHNDCWAKTPLQVAVENNQFQVLMHPVFKRLISIKWQQMGKTRAWMHAIINLMFCLCWTTRICFMPRDPREYYSSSATAELVFEVIAYTSYIAWVAGEILEYCTAKRNESRYDAYREKQLVRDLRFCHPRWPEERAYIEREIRSVQETPSLYVRDAWNYFDWATYAILGTSVIAHGINMSLKTRTSNDFSRSIASIALIFVWLRLLQYARPFQALGPFVVMLGHVTGDVVKIVFLLFQFYVPYLAAFWVMFGAFAVDGFTWTNGEILFSMFQMLVIGDYKLDKLLGHSPIMGRLLTSTFIFSAGIVCLNLFIALMADTFQRVYDNAKANAVMQRATMIVNMEVNFSPEKFAKHREWVSRNCAPESLYYDDDASDHDGNILQRMTFQIKGKVDKIMALLEDKLGTNDHKEVAQSSNEYPTASVGPHGIAPRTISHNVNLGYLRQQGSMMPHDRQSNGDVLRNDIDRLAKSLETFKGEFLVSQIKVRTEIAGLGLMLRDLIEMQSGRKENSIGETVSKDTASAEQTVPHLGAAGNAKHIFQHSKLQMLENIQQGQSSHPIQVASVKPTTISNMRKTPDNFEAVPPNDEPLHRGKPMTVPRAPVLIGEGFMEEYRVEKNSGLSPMRRGSSTTEKLSTINAENEGDPANLADDQRLKEDSMQASEASEEQLTDAAKTSS